MKSDLDALMLEAGLDGLIVTGARMHNPSLAYFVGPAHLTSADLLKKHGQAPVLFCRAMEREEAAATGLPVRLVEDYHPTQLLEQAGGDTARQRALLLERMLAETGLGGRVAVTGRADLGAGFAALQHLMRARPDVEFVGAVDGQDVITRARATKDEAEIERMRRIARITVQVVADVANFLTAHRARNGVLLNQHDEVLTIGEVKRRINLWLAMRGAENPEGAIFAVGREAGIPHSAGDDAAPVEVGKSIVFDLFPCEAGGGYFYDMTRTWCLGFAPDEVQRTHEDVLAVQQQMCAALRAGTPFCDYQKRTCQAFEARGHPTVHSQPGTREGYVHSLGHGVGLAVQERPFAGYTNHNPELLSPGAVVTVEPGLYYPERGYGVRIEDTLWIRPDGTAEVLAEFPRDLVLKVQGA